MKLLAHISSAPVSVKTSASLQIGGWQACGSSTATENPPKRINPKGVSQTETNGFMSGRSIAYDDDLNVPCPPHTTERKLVARIDLHVIPFLCVLYLLGKPCTPSARRLPDSLAPTAFLDRVNIANANVYGMSKQLNLTGDKYNIALVIFFAPYVLFEIPSNILLKRFKPRVWLSLNMFLFGFATILQGIVKSYGGLLATRFFLGLFETGMFPGCFYLIGMVSGLNGSPALMRPAK